MSHEAYRAPWDIVPDDEQVLADRRLLRILTSVLGIAILTGILIIIALALPFPGPWTGPARARLAKWVAWSVFGMAVLLAICWLFQYMKRELAQSMDQKCRGSAAYFVQREGKRHMRGRGVVLVAREGLEMRGRIDAPSLPQLLTVSGGGAIMLAVAWFLRLETFLMGAASAMGGFVALIVWLREKSLFVPHEDVEGISCKGPFVTLKFSKPPAKHLEYVSFYVNRALRREFFGALNAVFPGMLPRAYRETLAVTRG